MTDDSNKSYSLDNLQEWVRDVVESESTPKEIYDTIVETVKKNMKYHRACYRDSIRLLSLLKGKGESEVTELDEWRRIEDPSYSNYEEVYPGIKVATQDGITTEWDDYWSGNLYGEDFQEALEKYGYVYTPPTEEEVKRFKLDSPFLHNKEDN